MLIVWLMPDYVKPSAPAAFVRLPSSTTPGTLHNEQYLANFEYAKSP
jgi:hypothetical protein